MSAARKSVELQEKHTIMRRASAKKAHNNKVCTAKGPRDRRIRLSANIAIQFYDVQDRLGCERASEAVDWLISKAKGPINKLFDTRFHQEFDHVSKIKAQNSSTFQGDYLVESKDFDVQSGDYLPESLSGREDYGMAGFHNCTKDGSMFFPRIQMENRLQDQCFADHSTFSLSPCLEHSRISCFQQIDQKGEIPRMVMLNSKLSLKNGERSSVLNSLPFLQRPSEIEHNNGSSSVHTPNDPYLDLCLPANSISTFSDSEQFTNF